MEAQSQFICKYCTFPMDSIISCIVHCIVTTYLLYFLRSCVFQWHRYWHIYAEKKKNQDIFSSLKRWALSTVHYNGCSCGICYNCKQVYCSGVNFLDLRSSVVTVISIWFIHMWNYIFKQITRCLRVRCFL